MKRETKTKPVKLEASVKALFSLYWQFKSIFLFGDILRVVSSVVAAFLPLIIAKIVSSKGDINYLYFIVPVMVGTMVVHGILWSIADYNYSLRVLKVWYKFREVLFRTTWKRDYAEFMATPSGKTAATITRIQDHTDSLFGSYHWNFLTLFASVPVLAGLLVGVVLQNSISYILFLLFISIVLKYQLKAIKYAERRYADLNTTADGNIFDSFSNFVNVISFGARKKETKSFMNVNIELSKAQSKASTLMMTFWASAAFSLRGALWSIILFYNLYLLKNNEISFEQFVLCVTVLIEFTNIFWRLVETFGAFTEHYNKYKENYAFLFQDRNIVKEFFADKSRVNSLSEFKEVETPVFKETVVFNNMNFAYPDRSDKLVLKNLNLEISKGEKIGVVGKSGSGKSTLVKILLGFYDLEQDQLLVDTKNVSKEELALLNCYVPQDTTLFQQSIEFNIAYAKNEAVSHEDVVAAAKKAHAHEFILNLKYGYETLVGERGIKLSLGQRQRIALARAFLKDSQLLILDEATSSLDSKTESLVQESLEELWKDRTVIAVAHRLSTLNNVDRIIVIDKGEIVEQGTKAELLALNGIFTELWNHQANGMIIEDDEDEIEEV